MFIKGDNFFIEAFFFCIRWFFSQKIFFLPHFLYMVIKIKIPFFLCTFWTVKHFVAGSLKLKLPRKQITMIAITIVWMYSFWVITLLRMLAIPSPPLPSPPSPPTTPYSESFSPLRKLVTVFLSILNQMEFQLVQNRTEKCHHDHIPFNMKGNGNIVFSVYPLFSPLSPRLLRVLAKPAMINGFS